MIHQSYFNNVLKPVPDTFTFILKKKNSLISHHQANLLKYALLLSYLLCRPHRFHSIIIEGFSYLPGNWTKQAISF